MSCSQAASQVLCCCRAEFLCGLSNVHTCSTAENAGRIGHSKVISTSDAGYNLYFHMHDACSSYNFVSEKTERQDIAGSDAHTFRRYQNSRTWLYLDAARTGRTRVLCWEAWLQL